tara:strand:+ start:1155 stop:1505 length:351 start_codon:yes stop_codon:yes gene_type:complete
MRIFLMIGVVILSLNVSGAALANGGHASVTRTAECLKVADTDMAVPSVHYLEKSYARCLYYSRKAWQSGANNQDTAEDVSGDQTAPDVYSEDKIKQGEMPVQYHRITPRHKKEAED